VIRPGLDDGLDRRARDPGRRFVVWGQPGNGRDEGYIRQLDMEFGHPLTWFWFHPSLLYTAFSQEVIDTGGTTATALANE